MDVGADFIRLVKNNMKTNNKYFLKDTTKNLMNYYPVSFLPGV